MDKNKITKKDLDKILNGKRETQIINILLNKKFETVVNISKQIKLDQPTTTVILKKMEKFGLVYSQIDGKYRRKSIDQKRYYLLKSAFREIDNFEKRKIKEVFNGIWTKERDPFIYKQKSN